MNASDLTVRKVTAHGDLLAVHRLGRDTFSDDAQCTPGHFWPSLRQLERTVDIGGAVYVASGNTGDVGFITVEPTGQVMWLRAERQHIGAVCAACCAISAVDFGDCWGVVGSGTLRAAAVAADPAHFIDDGPATRILRFVL